VHIVDKGSNRVRKIDARTGIMSTVAGVCRYGYDGDDKPATEAALNNPSGVAAASNGDIYIADTLNFRVRMIDHATGFIHTIAGDGKAGDDDMNVNFNDGRRNSNHVDNDNDKRALCVRLASG